MDAPTASDTRRRMQAMDESSSDVPRRIKRQPLDLKETLAKMVNGQRRDVYRDLGINEPPTPGSDPPTLETDIDDLTDKQLMDLFVRFTRWTDYFQNQLAIEEIYEHHAEMEIRRLEGLYLTRNRPEKASEAVTWVRAQMETEPEIRGARDALKLYYARRKLKQMLFESSERDAAVVSRELTRRTDVKNPGYRRADRGAP
jgi:hypothetical protein